MHAICDKVQDRLNTNERHIPIEIEEYLLTEGYADHSVWLPTRPPAGSVCLFDLGGNNPPQRR